MEAKSPMTQLHTRNKPDSEFLSQFAHRQPKPLGALLWRQHAVEKWNTVRLIWPRLSVTSRLVCLVNLASPDASLCRMRTRLHCGRTVHYTACGHTRTRRAASTLFLGRKSG